MDKKISESVAAFLSKREPKIKRKTTAISSEQIKEIILQIGTAVSGKGFEVDLENKAQYQELCDYFTLRTRYEVQIVGGDAEVQKYSITVGGERKTYEKSLRKGVLIMGNTGTGKTDTMRVFAHYCRYLGNGLNIKEANCKIVGENFSIHGYEHLQKYYRGNWFFDDLGEEEIAKHYANQENVMAAIITQRYNAWKRTGVLSFATTNLNGDMLLNTYGERVFERICEMFNITILAGKNRRHDI